MGTALHGPPQYFSPQYFPVEYGMTEIAAWLAAGLALLLLAAVGVITYRILRRMHAAAQVRRRLALFPERNPQPVLSVSFDGQVRYANPAARMLATSLYANGNAASLLPSDLVDRMGTLLNSGQSDDHWEYLYQTSVLQCSVHCMEDFDVCHIYLKDLLRSTPQRHCSTTTACTIC